MSDSERVEKLETLVLKKLQELVEAQTSEIVELKERTETLLHLHKESLKAMNVMRERINKIAPPIPGFMIPEHGGPGKS